MIDITSSSLIADFQPDAWMWPVDLKPICSTLSSTSACWILRLDSEKSDARPDPLLWRASALHPAEDAAGCHGSSAGSRGGGAAMQLQL